MIGEQRQFATHRHNGLDGTAPISQLDFISVSLPGVTAATAANYGVFFIAPRNCVVKDFYESHEVAGSDAGAVTLQLERLQGTEAPGSGDDLLTATVSLKGTANTVVRGILSKLNRVVSLKTGDRLCLKDTGTLTALVGLCVTIIIEYTYN